jgi:hypothetical protein
LRTDVKDVVTRFAPEPFLRPSPATGRDADMLEV